MRVSLLFVVILALLSLSIVVEAKKSSSSSKRASKKNDLEFDHFDDNDKSSSSSSQKSKAELNKKKDDKVTNTLKKASSTKKKSKSESVSPSNSESSSTRIRLQEVVDVLPYTWLSDKNFTRYIVDRPRDYHAVVMFTATSKEYQCAICLMARDGFIDGAKAYHDQSDFESGIDVEHTDAIERQAAGAQRVAFFIMEITNARKTFDDMGLESVPRIYALPPTQEGSPKMRMQDFEIEIRAMTNGAKGFLEAVSEKTGVKMEAKTNPAPAVLYLGITAYLLGLLATNASKDPTAALLWYREPALWRALSILCFCVGVSGSIFCIIRSPPWYGNDYRGGTGIQIFAGQGREQYVLEGMIIAGVSVLVAIAGTVVVKAPSWTNLPSILRHVLVIAGLAVFVTFSIQLAEIYIFKTPWYNIKETIPEDIWTWMRGSVRKTSTLPKRIMRLSEIWLYEFKDWTGFGKKAKSLLVDYLFRSDGNGLGK
jgi:hypothetical protein